MAVPDYHSPKLTPGNYQLAIHVPNPLKNGHPVRFANETQDKHQSAWLSLGEVRIP